MSGWFIFGGIILVILVLMVVGNVGLSAAKVSTGG